MSRLPSANSYAKVGALLVALAWVALALGLERTGIVVRICALALAGIALLFLLDVIRLSRPDGRSYFERKAARPAAQKRPEELVDLERRVALATSTAFDLHYRVRPLLREAAAQRLLMRHGLDLDRDESAARRLLGDEAWAMVRGDRPPPADSWAPGMSAEALGRITEAVSRI